MLQGRAQGADLGRPEVRCLLPCPPRGLNLVCFGLQPPQRKAWAAAAAAAAGIQGLVGGGCGCFDLLRAGAPTARWGSSFVLARTKGGEGEGKGGRPSFCLPFSLAQKNKSGCEEPRERMAARLRAAGAAAAVAALVLVISGALVLPRVQRGAALLQDDVNHDGALGAVFGGRHAASAAPGARGRRAARPLSKDASVAATSALVVGPRRSERWHHNCFSYAGFSYNKHSKSSHQPIECGECYECFE